MENQIHSTKDYDKFKPLPFNRGSQKINRSHLVQLEKSVLEKNLLPSRPMVVADDFTIIDGHHRLEIAKKHNLDIYYVILPEGCYEDSIRLTRGTTDWSLKGYVECRAANDEPEFKKLRDFTVSNAICCHILFRMFSRCGRNKTLSKSIKTGTFKFTKDFEGLKPFIDIIHLVIKQCKDLGMNHKKLQQSEFWYGCYSVISHPSIRIKRFLTRIETDAHKITKELSSWRSVAKSLVLIYNHDLDDSHKISIHEILDVSAHKTDITKFEKS